jgi:hypothetical protein
MVNMFSLKIIVSLFIGCAASNCSNNIARIVNSHRDIFPDSILDRRCWTDRIGERLDDIESMDIQTQCLINFHKNMCMMVDEQLLTPADDICSLQYSIHLYKAKQCTHGYENALKLRTYKSIKIFEPITNPITPFNPATVILILFMICILPC